MAALPTMGGDHGDFTAKPLEDWTTKAAEAIEDLYPASRGPKPTTERIASIIAAHAEPLVALLREAKREHQWDEDDKCDKLNKIDPAEKVCTCGADAWNARVDAALVGYAKCDGNHGGPRCADPECWNQ